MEIKQSVINTFNRVGIPYDEILQRVDAYKKDANVTLTEVVANQFGHGSCETHPLISECIRWVYKTGIAYENGDYSVKTADFDRVRYFVLEKDSKAYMTCLD